MEEMGFEGCVLLCVCVCAFILLAHSLELCLDELSVKMGLRQK